MKKSFVYLFFFIVFLIITINIFSLLNISFLGFRIYRVASGSMEPTLNVNDIILIKKGDYQIGDIITYYDENKQFITHRIVFLDNEKVITKGDANETNDTPINEKDIIGKYVYRIKSISLINRIFYKPFTWIVFFALGIIIISLIPNKKTTE